MAGLIAGGPAVVVEEPVSGDRTDPGGRVRAALEARAGADCLHERLGRDLLGKGCVTGRPSKDEAVHARQNSFVPGPEGVLVRAQGGK